MKLAYGTLGWHADYLKPTIKKVEDLDRLVFYFGHTKKKEHRTQTMDTKREMEKFCKGFDIEPDARRLPDIYDLAGIVKLMKSGIEKDRDDGHQVTMFNIAGGTKPMCAAALLVCIFKGIPTLYVNEETLDEVQLPLLEADYLGNLTPRERELAEYILKHKDTMMTQAKIARSLERTPATINKQINNLHRKGIITFETTDDTRLKQIRLSDGMELLLG